MATTSPSDGQPGLGSLLNQSTLELSECRKDVENQFTGRIGRVDRALAEGTESDAATSYVFDNGNQMLHRPAETIQSPHD